MDDILKKEGLESILMKGIAMLDVTMILKDNTRNTMARALYCSYNFVLQLLCYQFFCHLQVKHSIWIFFYSVSPFSAFSHCHCMPLKPHLLDVSTNLECQHQLVQTISSSHFLFYHHSANLSFSLLSIFFSYIYIGCN